jgi:GAF domain-containing protein
LLERVGVISKTDRSNDDRVQAACSLLRDFVPAFDWVGIYRVSEKHPEELELGPFVGAPTEHTRIPFGKGICGQAAVTKKPFVVPDVSQEPNYLSCSPDVKSEIVMPLIKDGEFVAQLDIDSHTPTPFDEKDQTFLEKVCEILAPLV